MPIQFYRYQLGRIGLLRCPPAADLVSVKAFAFHRVGLANDDDALTSCMRHANAGDCILVTLWCEDGRLIYAANPAPEAMPPYRFGKLAALSGYLYATEDGYQWVRVEQPRVVSRMLQARGATLNHDPSRRLPLRAVDEATLSEVQKELIRAAYYLKGKSPRQSRHNIKRALATINELLR